MIMVIGHIDNIVIFMYVVLNIIIALKGFENSAICSVKMNHILNVVF